MQPGDFDDPGWFVPPNVMTVSLRRLARLLWRCAGKEGKFTRSGAEMEARFPGRSEPEQSRIEIPLINAGGWCTSRTSVCAALALAVCRNAGMQVSTWYVAREVMSFQQGG